METEIGKIIHCYDKISVAVLRLSAELKAGDTVHIKGPSTDFEQVIDSMQVNHETVKGAVKGEEVAVKLEQKARSGDRIYRK